MVEIASQAEISGQSAECGMVRKLEFTTVAPLLASIHFVLLTCSLVMRLVTPAILSPVLLNVVVVYICNR